MIDFIQSQLIFYVAIAGILFLPGYLLLWAIFGKGKLGSLEKLVASFGLSITLLNFLLFVFSKIGIRLTAMPIILGIVGILIVCGLIYFYKNANKAEKADDADKLFNFSKKQFALILIFLFLTFLIKTAYLSNSVIPTATDMGHHMYWAKMMSLTGSLSTYDGMPDFIIGEHTIFSVLNILSGVNFFSAFPIVILYLVNIFSILAVFILTLRIFNNKNVAILSLLFLGIIYAVSSPQAKFVSGGVIGNVLGNYFLPIIFYFYFRAFKFLSNKEILRQAQDEKNSKAFLSLAIFLTFGMFYTHHLTSFVFLFSFLFLIIFFLIVNYANLEEVWKKTWRVVFSWEVLATLAICLLFFFFIFTPTYVSGKAVDTAVGSPVKSTRTGLSLENINSTVGDPRMALGIVGLIFLGIFYQKRNFGYAIVVAWPVMIFSMSVKPGWLFVDIPSNRIGNYLTYPIAILCAYGFWTVFKNLKINNLVRVGYFLLIIFVFSWGFRDSATLFKQSASSSELTQTFEASAYLAQSLGAEDKILKDHNYLTADAWIKLFFMRGYRFPESRGYFKRYEDPTNPREMCTLYMISEPASENGKKCFAESGTNFLMINPIYDSGQFMKTNNFDWVYAGEKIGIFYKK